MEQQIDGYVGQGIDLMEQENNRLPNIPKITLKKYVFNKRNATLNKLMDEPFMPCQ
ncbi:hypothetical protein [Olivibacter sitiensis]|uniref:hypothetical protein n=1 Tax=Olivibacter sitiensis TaxID=376470 RepID=UPI00041E4647|nr:hypothetical protein [Olivibacter sitiensis]